MPIVFHAKRSRDNRNPSHTLCFEHKDGALLCTYSKPHPGLEPYCKATGTRVVKSRMRYLSEEETPEGSYRIKV